MMVTILTSLMHDPRRRTDSLDPCAGVRDAIAALSRDPERYGVESVWSISSGAQAVSVATSRLHNIAGKYTGKDDPVMLVRVQSDFSATGEVVAPDATGHFVAGAMRGSHQMPLMPVPLGSGISYFDGPPV